MKLTTRRHIEQQKLADSTIARVWSPDWEQALEKAIKLNLKKELAYPAVHPAYKSAIAAIGAESLDDRAIYQIQLIAEMDAR